MINICCYNMQLFSLPQCVLKYNIKHNPPVFGFRQIYNHRVKDIIVFLYWSLVTTYGIERFLNRIQKTIFIGRRGTTATTNIELELSILILWDTKLPLSCEEMTAECPKPFYFQSKCMIFIQMKFGPTDPLPDTLYKPQ